MLINIQKPIFFAHEKLLNRFCNCNHQNIGFTSAVIILTDLHYRRGHLRNSVPYSKKANGKDQVEYMSGVMHNILTPHSAKKAFKVIKEEGLIEAITKPSFNKKFSAQNHGTVFKLNFSSSNLEQISINDLSSKKVAKYLEAIKELYENKGKNVLVNYEQIKDIELMLKLLRFNYERLNIRDLSAVTEDNYWFLREEFEYYIKNEELQYATRFGLRTSTLPTSKLAGLSLEEHKFYKTRDH